MDEKVMNSAVRKDDVEIASGDAAAFAGIDKEMGTVRYYQMMDDFGETAFVRVNNWDSRFEDTITEACHDIFFGYGESEIEDALDELEAAGYKCEKIPVTPVWLTVVN